MGSGLTTLRLVHPYMPSHVVDCDHKHDGREDGGSSENHNHEHAVQKKGEPTSSGNASESTALLSSTVSDPRSLQGCEGNHCFSITNTITL